MLLLSFGFKGMKFVGNVPVDGFIHRTLPINCGKEMGEMNAQGGSDQQQVIIRDAQETGFDFGNGAAGGVMPSGELQFDSQLFLRPTLALAQLANLFSNQILHVLCNRFTSNSQSASSENEQLFNAAFAGRNICQLMFTPSFWRKYGPEKFQNGTIFQRSELTRLASSQMPAAVHLS
jgi:hypothetical protein